MNLRKSLFRYVCVLVFLAAAACSPSIRGATDPVDPVVGSWVWNKTELVTFHADGTVHHSHGADGTWSYLHNPEVQRHYRIIWKHGVNTDDVVCSEDGQRAHIRNDGGKQFDARRTLDDKPAASPAPARSAVNGAGAAPEKTAAGPTGAVDPVIGEWQWEGDRLKFEADGTITSAKGPAGTWEFLHNPEADRQYRVVWTGGKFSVDLTYDSATHIGHVVNSRGKRFDVRPWSAADQGKAAPGKAGDYFGTSGQ